MQLEQLLKRPQALPTAPKTVRQLMSTFGQDNVDCALVARLIEDDPVLTARLLKTANSAFFGLRRAVGNVAEAVHVLGLTKVRALVIAAALDQGFRSVPGVDLSQFWRYSLNTAQLSHTLARPIAVDVGAAFTAGLVHGIGELVMHAGMPEAMTELNDRVPMLNLDRPQAERERFGYSFAEVGAALAAEWQFPVPMVQAIVHQGQPFGQAVHDPIAGVVHIASWRSRAEELSLNGDALIRTYPDAVGGVLGITPDILVGEDAPPLTSRDSAPAPA